MQLRNINHTYYIKDGDTATKIKLQVLDYENQPFDLKSAEKVEVIIGINEGRLLTKEPDLLDETGVLEFRIDEDDVLVVGKNLVEVHITTIDGRLQKAPSKGYYELILSRSIDTLGANVTKVTLQYVLDEVEKTKQDLTDEVENAIGYVDAKISQMQSDVQDVNERLAQTVVMSFNNSSISEPRINTNNRKVVSHLNGAVRATSTGVLVDNSAPNKMTIDTPGNNTYTVIFDATRDFNEILSNYIELSVMADWTKINSITLKIVPDKTNTSDYYSRLISRTRNPKILDSYPTNQPVLLRVSRNSFTKNGNPAFFGLDSNSEIHLLVGTREATRVTFLDGILASEPLAPTMIMFDDGDIGVYEYAFPVMKERGIPGTFFVITNNIGEPGWCSWEQLHEMQEAGWTIANHTSNHINLMESTLDEAIEAIEQGSDALSSRGFRGANILAAPYNALDSTRQPYVSHVVKSLRLGADGNNAYNNPLYSLTYPAIVRARSVINTDTPQYVFENDYLAKKQQGYLQAINYHVINTDGYSQFTYKASDFEATMDLLVNDGATFINYEEYLNVYLS